MSRNKIIAGMTSLALIATAVTVAPPATAVQLHSEERLGREICVATLSDRETQISRDYFQKLLDEHAKLQQKLRAAYPQFASIYEEADRRTARGEVSTASSVGLFTALRESDFYVGEMELFIFDGTAEYLEYKRLAEEGFEFAVEIAPGWSKDELASYPFGGAPVLPVGADWSRTEVSSKSISIRHSLKNLYPESEMTSTVHSEVARPYIQSHTYAITTIQDAFIETFHYNTFQDAAEDCLASVDTSKFPPIEAAPTTTYTPTVTVTVPAHTATVTPEPSTVTAKPSTSVVEPSPVTTTAVPSTVTVVPESVTVTAVPGTVVETAEPVTTTVTPGAATVTAEPVTTTVEPAPVTVTGSPSTVTKTSRPVTTVVTAEPTTVTTTPTVTETPSVGNKGEAGSHEPSENLGITTVIVMLFAIIGGVVGFLLQGIA